MALLSCSVLNSILLIISLSIKQELQLSMDATCFLQQSAREKSSCLQQNAWISTQPCTQKAAQQTTSDSHGSTQHFVCWCVRGMTGEKQPASCRQKYLEHKVPERGKPGRRKALQKLYEKNRCWGSNMKHIQYPVLNFFLGGLCLSESQCTQDGLRTKACWAKTQSCKAFSGAVGSSRTCSRQQARRT